LAAEQGLAKAQYNLGVCYEQGLGVEQSYNKAVKWYKLSAEQGLAEAQNNLGGCYVNGHGVEQSYKEAVKWYRMAAEQGLANAQNSFQRIIVQVKSSLQQFGLAVKESFNNFKQVKTQLSSMITKVKEWGKAHLSVSKQIKSAKAL
jgi:hypothetical protein